MRQEEPEQADHHHGQAVDDGQDDADERGQDDEGDQRERDDEPGKRDLRGCFVFIFQIVDVRWRELALVDGVGDQSPPMP